MWVIYHEEQRESPRVVCGVKKIMEKNTGRKIKVLHSDNTRDLDKCQFTTGHVFTLSQALVCWCFILQSTITSSTMKAEYMAMTETMKEAILL